MFPALAEPPVAEAEAAGALSPESGPAAFPSESRKSAEQKGPRHAGWVLALFWILAFGFIALTAANYRLVAVAADGLEAACRRSPLNVVGRGACDTLARVQPPVMYDPDSQVWINLTQRQVRDGTVRPHDFPYDNAPTGRERHWSSSFSWWLLLLGGLTHWLGGMPMDAAIAQSAAWANPVLFALFLAGLGIMLRKRLDAWSTGVFLVTLAALWGVEWDFSYGRPDHHGLHLMAFLGLVLGALLGGLGWTRVGPTTANEVDILLVRPATWQQARGWFTVSGVCGGLGLWIGSTQQAVCIAVLGAGAVLAVLWFGGRQRQVNGVRFAPELWLHWSRVGALTSLAFYVIEYFPSHMEMRLEVNHPLLAVGWLGAGELMVILMLLRTDGANAHRRRGRELAMRGVMGLLAMSLFPLAVAYGPRDWCWLRDPVLLRSTKVISEGRPWIDPPSLARAWHEIWSYTGALLLTLPLTLAVLAWRRRQLPAWRLAGLVVGGVLVTVFLGWTLLQNRWMGFMETSLAMLALLVAPCVPVSLPGRRCGAVLPVVLLALTVPGWAGYGLLQTRTFSEDSAVHARAVLGDMMAGKELAWNLQLAAEARMDGTRPARVMAAPGPSPVLHYYGGVDTVASYYWENLGGCHVAIDFYNDEGEATARRITRERGLDFVVVTAKPTFVLELQWLKLGRVDIAAARRTLAFRLANPLAGNIPGWLEAVPLLDAPMARADGARIYRVVKERL